MPTPPARNSTGRGVLQSPPFAVVRARCFTLAQKTALLVMWSRCDEDGWCWPTIPQIAEDMNCNVKTARDAVGWLLENGVITAESGPNNTRTYRIEPVKVVSFIESSPTKTGTTKSGRATKTGRAVLPEVGGQALPKQVDKGNTDKETKKDNQLPSPSPSLLSVATETTPDAVPEKKPTIKKTPDPRVTQVRLQIEQLQGYAFSNPVAENVAIKKLLAQAEPDEIVGCWKALRGQSWRTARITMQTVLSNLGEYRQGRLVDNRATSTYRNGNSPAIATAPRPDLDLSKNTYTFRRREEPA